MPAKIERIEANFCHKKVLGQVEINASAWLESEGKRRTKA
jgi:hypothetical protein